MPLSQITNKVKRLFSAANVARRNAWNGFQDFYHHGFDPYTQDSLTRVYNRRHFDQRRASLDHYSLILIDVDHFKAINDQHGHFVGDEVLRQIASALKVRAEDKVFRVGGEEFAVLLKSDIEGANIVAERLCAAVRELSIFGHLKVTVSAGVAWTKRQFDHDFVYQLADQALYNAKSAGRDQVVCAEQAGRFQCVSNEACLLI